MSGLAVYRQRQCSIPLRVYQTPNEPHGWSYSFPGALEHMSLIVWTNEITSAVKREYARMGWSIRWTSYKAFPFVLAALTKRFGVEALQQRDDYFRRWGASCGFSDMLVRAFLLDPQFEIRFLIGPPSDFSSNMYSLGRYSSESRRVGEANQPERALTLSRHATGPVLALRAATEHSRPDTFRLFDLPNELRLMIVRWSVDTVSLIQGTHLYGAAARDLARRHCHYVRTVIPDRVQSNRAMACVIHTGSLCFICDCRSGVPLPPIALVNRRLAIEALTYYYSQSVEWFQARKQEGMPLHPGLLPKLERYLQKAKRLELTLGSSETPDSVQPLQATTSTPDQGPCTTGQTSNTVVERPTEPQNEDESGIAELVPLDTTRLLVDDPSILGVLESGTATDDITFIN